MTLEIYQKLFAAAWPPDVKISSESRAHYRFDAHRCGFAAGCEAGLRPAVEL